MELFKYTLGVGDRFGLQGKAQLSAFQSAAEAGVHVCPVWNKSYREHVTTGTLPGSVRDEADAAVGASGWNEPYYVDADHIGMNNVDLFIDSSDYFTIDVADLVGKAASEAEIEGFVSRHRALVGTLSVPGFPGYLTVTEADVHRIAGQYLAAIREAGRIYRHIADKKGADTFVTEVSLDETDKAQSPTDLLFILAALGEESIPVQTVAPKFIGRFNKGVDYVGNPEEFSVQFEEDILIIKYAIEVFGLPGNLKLSVHTGSDKFSLYRRMGELVRKHDVGLHVKTAGTTWLEEVIGLAVAGGAGLKLARRIYRIAYGRIEELCAKYTHVIDIDPTHLPDPDEADRWDGETFASTLRHDQLNARYNRDFRQLIHLGYKIAAELGDEYMQALRENETVVAEMVRTNILDRHLLPLFGP